MLDLLFKGYLSIILLIREFLDKFWRTDIAKEKALILRSVGKVQRPQAASL